MYGYIWISESGDTNYLYNKSYLLHNSLFDRISVPNVLQIVAPKING